MNEFGQLINDMIATLTKVREGTNDVATANDTANELMRQMQIVHSKLYVDYNTHKEVN